MKYKSLLIYCFLFTTLSPCITFANVLSAPNVWDVLRSQLSLNHEIHQPAVQNQIQWIASHPGYIKGLALQSKPYIYHIVTELRKRGLPGELALIPMIESSYNPFAYSGAGAAGLWQLMPGTGTELGLKQDWWFDGRRSIRPSTDAALNYLSYLHHFFNDDWLLAFAAYDAGEGALARIIKNSRYTGRQVSFWSLDVPQETRAYIPRLLALAEVIQNPQRYKVELPDIPHLPYFEEVNIGSPIDLNHAAKLAGISYRDLIKLNPGFNRWSTAPNHPYKLLIPADRVADFNRNLANVPIDKRVSWIRHKVRPGENLLLIAQKYHTTVNLIKELNQLKTTAVSDGETILIPSSKNTTVLTKKLPLQTIKLSPAQPRYLTLTKQYKVIHIVQRNESYEQIQKKYGVTANDIQAWNQLKETTLAPGQQLIIWKHAPTIGLYVVKPGDSLATIAKQNNTSTITLMKLNPGLTFNIQPGQKIRLG